MKRIPRIGVGGPVGSGKTSLIEALVPMMMERGCSPLVITNDIFTREDEDHVRRTLQDVFDVDRIRGVSTGACPHTAVREDPSHNLLAVEELSDLYPDGDLFLIESGGDNLTLTFSPALADFQIYVIDVAAGDKIPRKRGQGITQTDLLVVNKTDLAPHVGADLDIMRRDLDLVRGSKPYLFTNCRKGKGLDKVLDRILEAADAFTSSQ
ncbi:MAG: urease accessory protein UreG [Chloroflexota bacterium]|nr:urease accessory protein UreG [Chloroflexota bacterium]